MRIKIQQFLFGGTLWSWAAVGQNIGRAFLKAGHDVEFVSTDGVQGTYVPDDLKAHVRERPTGQYDCQVSYTAMHNFPHYLAHGIKNRFGIWNLDSTIVPQHMLKFYNFCDKTLPSSDFSKQVFVESGIPEDHLVVVPHGINLEDYNTKDKYSLKTKKKTKILLNIATPHKRKNIKNTLKTYFTAFTKDDDVCLVVKINLRYKNNQANFHIHFMDVLKKFTSKRGHAEVEVISNFIPSMVGLYNACDIVFMMSNLEQFWMPGLEGMAAGKIIIASNWGGQTHYLKDNNSLLISGDIVRMPRLYQYWVPDARARMASPSIDDGVAKLRYAVENYDVLMDKLAPKMKETVQRLTWANVARQIEELCEK